MTRREVLAGGAAWAGAIAAQAGGRPDGLAPDGDLRLSLAGAVARKGPDAKERDDLELDLRRRGGTWQSEAWGFAAAYNSADGHGTAGFLENGDRLTVHVYLDIGAVFGVPLTAAKYDLTLKRTGSRFEGTYQGIFDTRRVEGKVTGEFAPPYPAPPPSDFVPVALGEHPRLIFRRSETAYLRGRATTEWGRAIVTRLRGLLSRSLLNKDRNDNPAAIAAGYAFLAYLTGDRSGLGPMSRRLEDAKRPPSGRVGVDPRSLLCLALAYDFGFDFRESSLPGGMHYYLTRLALESVTQAGPGAGMDPAGNHEAVRRRAAAGVALLAVAGDVDGATETERALTICERTVRRYLERGVGEHGFGAEGDTAHIETMEIVFPFLQALRTARGRELAAGPIGGAAAWTLPLYLLRSFPVEAPSPRAGTTGQPNFQPYGPGADSRRSTPPGLFATGLGSVRSAHLPAVREFVDRYWGLSGDRTFGVDQPYYAPFMLALYPDAVAAQPWWTVFPRAVRDERMGFFVFRTADVIAVLYARTAPAKGSGSPDAGDFRIHGFGTDWVTGAPNIAQVRQTGVEATGAGRSLYQDINVDGSGAVSLDLSGVYRQGNEGKETSIRSERAFVVDYSGQCGAPALFVLGDRVLGGTERVWKLHTAGKAVALTPDGFMVDGGNGATLRATFVSPAPVRLSVIDESQPVKTVEARSDDPKTATFFVIMTVQQGAAPAVVVQGTGPNRIVTVGGVPVRWVEGTTAPPKKATPPRK